MTCLVRIGTPRPTVLRAVVCGPCWAAHGGSPDAADIGPTPLQTVLSLDPAGQGQWLRALRRQPWVEAARADARRNVLNVARLVALHAQWDTLESRPTWARLIDRSGLSERTVARWLQELRVRGWLAHLEHGSTPSTRPMALAHLDGNRAALYGLRIPLTPDEALAQAGDGLVQALAGMLKDAGPDAPGTGSEQPERGRVGDKNGTLPLSVKDSHHRQVGGFTRASEPVDNFTTSRHDTHQNNNKKLQKTALRAGSEEANVPDLSIMVPVSRYEMLVCADWLRSQRSVFVRCSRRLVRALCRPYWRAGWCNRDILHALDHRPSVFHQATGVLISPTYIASPRQFIRSRLTAWRTPDAVILVGHWTSRVADATTTKDTQAQVTERYGRVAARVLGPGDQALTAERITEYGRTCRPAGSAEARSTAHAATPPAPATMTTRTRRRLGKDDELAARLLAEARAELARRAAETDSATPATQPKISASRFQPSAEAGQIPARTQDTGGSVYERARARARDERGRGMRRRGRPR